MPYEVGLESLSHRGLIGIVNFKDIEVSNFLILNFFLRTVFGVEKG
jgi:hypothetical protein